MTLLIRHQLSSRRSLHYYTTRVIRCGRSSSPTEFLLDLNCLCNDNNFHLELHDPPAEQYSWLVRVSGKPHRNSFTPALHSSFGHILFCRTKPKSSEPLGVSRLDPLSKQSRGASLKHIAHQDNVPWGFMAYSNHLTSPQAPSVFPEAWIR